eukprot:jgi/Botrbrau1/21118/Bobra.0061s0013.1
MDQRGSYYLDRSDRLMEYGQQWNVCLEDLEITREIRQAMSSRVFAGRLHQTDVEIRIPGALQQEAKGQQSSRKTSLEGLQSDPSRSPRAFLEKRAASLPVGNAQEVLKNLRNEVRVMADTRHPNVLMMLGVCLEWPCLITEMCSKGTLAELLSKARSDPSKVTHMGWMHRLKMAWEIAKGVLHLHTRNPVIVHGDLRTANILVNSSWHCKVAEFGMAHVEGRVTKPLSPEATGIHHLAPEVQLGGDSTMKSDVYAFGMILLELLTLLPPQNTATLLQMFCGEELTWKMADMIDKTVPGMNEYLELTRRCVSQDPSRRPNFDTIGAQLRNLLYNTEKNQTSSPQRSLATSPTPSAGARYQWASAKTFMMEGGETSNLGRPLLSSRHSLGKRSSGCASPRGALSTGTATPSSAGGLYSHDTAQASGGGGMYPHTPPGPHTSRLQRVGSGRVSGRFIFVPFDGNDTPPADSGETKHDRFLLGNRSLPLPHETNQQPPMSYAAVSHPLPDGGVGYLPASKKDSHCRVSLPPARTGHMGVHHVTSPFEGFKPASSMFESHMEEAAPACARHSPHTFSEASSAGHLGFQPQEPRPHLRGFANPAYEGVLDRRGHVQGPAYPPGLCGVLSPPPSAPRPLLCSDEKAEAHLGAFSKILGKSPSWSYLPSTPAAAVPAGLQKVPSRNLDPPQDSTCPSRTMPKLPHLPRPDSGSKLSMSPTAASLRQRALPTDWQFPRLHRTGDRYESWVSASHEATLKKTQDYSRHVGSNRF